MRVNELTHAQLSKITMTNPEWMAKNKPEWMVKNRPDWIAKPPINTELPKHIEELLK